MRPTAHDRPPQHLVVADKDAGNWFPRFRYWQFSEDLPRAYSGVAVAAAMGDYQALFPNFAPLCAPRAQFISLPCPALPVLRSRWYRVVSTHGRLGVLHGASSGASASTKPEVAPFANLLRACCTFRFAFKRLARIRQAQGSGRSGTAPYARRGRGRSRATPFGDGHGGL
jgi:hypothetical protein